MKKVFLLSFCVLAVAAYAICNKVYASKAKSHSKQVVQAQWTYAWKDPGTDVGLCFLPASNCFKITVLIDEYSGFVNAVNAGTVSQFFSSPNNLQQFGVNNAVEMQELQDPSLQSVVIETQKVNGQSETVVAFGYSTALTADNADFIMDVISTPQN